MSGSTTFSNLIRYTVLAFTFFVYKMYKCNGLLTLLNCLFNMEKNRELCGDKETRVHACSGQDNSLNSAWC